MPFIKGPNWANESYPFCFYRRIGIAADNFQILFPLEPGYHFMMEMIFARYASENVNLAGLYANPLQIYFRKDAQQKALFNIPLDIPLFVNPGTSGIAVNTAGGANPNFPHTAPVDFDKSKAWQTLYFFRDIIFMEISGVTVNGGTAVLSLPPFLEILIKGRYFPGKPEDVK